MVISIPAAAAQALFLLRAAGFEAVAVGGCVRDTLLGRAPSDWDIATAATPDEMKAVFSGRRVVETGIRHGTLTVLFDGTPVEITSFRADGDYSDARHPDAVRFTRSLSEDLARRDFTVNTLCADANGAVIDPMGGLADLNANVIRAVGEPEARFREDALRILRALRFSAQLGFSIEPATAAALRGLRARLSLISFERIFSELARILCAPDCARVLLEFPEVLFAVIPELSPSLGLFQRPDYHCFDVYGHTVRAVAAAPVDPVLRTAMLLHDVGKPACSDGAGHFHGHAAESVRLSSEILNRLRCTGEFKRRVLLLVRLHDRPVSADRRALRRLLATLGEQNLRDLLAVRRADIAAQNPSLLSRRAAQLNEAARMLDGILAERPCLTREALAVGGRDLLEAGHPPGAALGKTLDFLLREVVDERLPNERDALLGAARAFAGVFAPPDRPGGRN